MYSSSYWLTYLLTYKEDLQSSFLSPLSSCSSWSGELSHNQAGELCSLALVTFPANSRTRSSTIMKIRCCTGLLEFSFCYWDTSTVCVWRDGYVHFFHCNSDKLIEKIISIFHIQDEETCFQHFQILWRVKKRNANNV